MIPKKIHYCWFGGSPLPLLAEKCIASWKKYCPEYEIIKWDETNFELNCCTYVEEAYKAKKWAFVSDFARFQILYKEGGIYFDTDVELIKPIDDLLVEGFMACEKCYYFKNDSWFPKIKDSPGIGVSVAAGLGLASEAGNPLFKEIIDDYCQSNFIMQYGIMNKKTVVKRVTDILEQYGFNKYKNEVQEIKGMKIYATDYFAGLDNISYIITITKNTRAIHHGAASWTTPSELKTIRIHKKFKGKGKIIFLLGYIIFAPLSLYNRFKEYGCIPYLKYLLSKLGIIKNE